MDFILSHDWLNRGLDSYAFQWDHLVSVFFYIIVAVVLCFILRKRSHKTVKIVLIVLYALATASQLSYYVIRYALCISDPSNYQFDLGGMLPLHSCYMFIFIFPVAMWCKNPIIKTAANNFLVVVNMIMGFITMFVGCPPGGYSALSFNGSQELFYHALIYIVPLIMLVTNWYDLKKWDIKWGIALFCALATTIYIFDAIFDVDYFFIYTGKNFGILYEISENVPHMVWTLIVMSCYVITAFIIHFAVYYIKFFIANKIKKQEIPQEA